MFMALESVLRSLVTDMGSPKDIGELARFLRDHPDHFPMFSTVPDQVPSTEHFRRCKAMSTPEGNCIGGPEQNCITTGLALR